MTILELMLYGILFFVGWGIFRHIYFHHTGKDRPTLPERKHRGCSCHVCKDL